MTTHNPSDLAALVRDAQHRGLAGATPSRMVVDSVDSAGLVLVKSVRSGAIAEGPYQQLAHVGALSPGDMVQLTPEVGTTGAMTYVVSGRYGGGAAGASTTVVTAVGSANTAAVESVTSQTDYATALAVDLVLPAGTWTVAAVGGLAIRHSAGSANWRIEIDGIGGTGRSLYVATEMQMVDDAIATGVTGGRTVLIRVQYKSSDPGTAYARNPWVMATASRQ